MVCHWCQTEVRRGIRYCTHCGGLLDPSAPPAAPPRGRLPRSILVAAALCAVLAATVATYLGYDRWRALLSAQPHRASRTK
jgi:hypothetical protein